MMTGKKAIRLAIVTTFVVVLVALLGCQPPAPTAPTPSAATKAPAAPATQAPAAAATQAPATVPTQAPTAAPTPAPQTLKVGIIMCITGPSARTGQISERVIRMGIDDVNARGGIKVGGQTYLIQAVTADDKFTADGGRDAANRLVLAEKVKIIFGPCNPGATSGAQPTTDENKVLMLTTQAIPENLGPKHPLTLMDGVPTEYSRNAANYSWLAKTHPEVKRIVTVGSDDTSGRNHLRAAEQNAAARGMTIVASEFFPLSLGDFSPLAVRVLAQKPDWIDGGGTLGAFDAAFAGFSKAIYDLGWRKGFSAGWGWARATQVGPPAEGFVFPVLTDCKASLVPKAAQDVCDRFIQKYGVDNFEASSVTYLYDMMPVLAQAMEKAGTVDDTAKIADTLRAGEWNTVLGKVRFIGAKTYGAPSVLGTPTFLNKVEGGKILTIDLVPSELP